MVTITTNDLTARQLRVVQAMVAPDASRRLHAALTAGSDPDPAFVETLVERCAVEDDFFVRDMVTWALTRHPAAVTLPRLRGELDSGRSQARSQALHTLSKIRDRSTWPWITRDVLRSPDGDVARTAWRAAVTLVPEGEEEDLADELVLQLGRGDRSLQLSLSRAFIDLGDVSRPALRRAAEHPDRAWRLTPSPRSCCGRTLRPGSRRRSTRRGERSGSDGSERPEGLRTPTPRPRKQREDGVVTDR